MDEIFQRIVGNIFSDLKGATADASIPLPQDLINESIQAALLGNKNIESCLVSVHSQNRAEVNLKTALLPWALNLKLKLDKSVDFASYSSPKVRAWLENNRLLGSLGSFFNLLPEGIKLYGNQVVVDISAFLRTPQEKKLLTLIKSIDIHTEEGKAILEVKIEVT
jgi:hypothetical protein